MSSGTNINKRKKRSTVETVTIKKTEKEKQKSLLRSNSASTLLGLTILLYPDVNQYKLSVNNFEGFKVSFLTQKAIFWPYVDKAPHIFTAPQVLVHSPFSFPEVSSRGFAIDRNKEVFIGVSAQYTERYPVAELNANNLQMFYIKLYSLRQLK